MATKVILLRHGEAKNASDDAERPLSERGTEEIERVAAFIGRMKLNCKEIRHSVKKRAEQTALILAKHIQTEHGCIAVPGLTPNSDPKPVADMLNIEESSVALVGHLPHLSYLAGLLLVKNPDRELIHFTTATAVCLSKQYGLWMIEWIVNPRIIK